MEYLHNNKNLFKDTIDFVVYKTGTAPEIVEKDYYVTMILHLLSEFEPAIVFKGGTSLSKCYHLIKRFSEDIDIAVDTLLSQSRKKHLKESIIEIAKILELNITNLNDTYSRRDFNRYIIEYNSVYSAKTSVLQSTVLIETSFTTLSFPSALLSVDNYIQKTISYESPELIEKYNLAPFIMKVQGINRTLIDKVFAICDYYLQDKIKRHSRHIYDIYKILPTISQNSDFKMLISEVRNIRKASAICPSAQEEISIPELLNTIVKEKVYRNDYINLTSKLLEEDISYETAISSISEIINSGMFN